jgi:hypothetical protein
MNCTEHVHKLVARLATVTADTNVLQTTTGSGGAMLHCMRYAMLERLQRKGYLVSHPFTVYSVGDKKWAIWITKNTPTVLVSYFANQYSNDWGSFKLLSERYRQLVEDDLATMCSIELFGADYLTGSGKTKVALDRLPDFLANAPKGDAAALTDHTGKVLALFVRSTKLVELRDSGHALGTIQANTGVPVGRFGDGSLIASTDRRMLDWVWVGVKDGGLVGFRRHPYLELLGLIVGANTYPPAVNPGGHDGGQFSVYCSLHAAKGEPSYTRYATAIPDPEASTPKAGLDAKKFVEGVWVKVSTY